MKEMLKLVLMYNYYCKYVNGIVINELSTGLCTESVDDIILLENVEWREVYHAVRHLNYIFFLQNDNNK